MAGIYYQEKNIDSTIFYYEKAVKNFPEKEDLKLTLGNLYSEDKKYEKANSIFESFDKAYGYNKTSTLSEIRNLIAETKYDEAMSKTMILLKENQMIFGIMDYLQRYTEARERSKKRRMCMINC